MSQYTHYTHTHTVAKCFINKFPREKITICKQQQKKKIETKNMPTCKLFFAKYFSPCTCVFVCIIKFKTTLKI